MPTFTPTTQSAIVRYGKALKSIRGLFNLYPDPRPQGAPPLKYRPLPPAIVQGMTAAFEGFAEELVVVALLQRQSSWAHVAANADLTNPTLPVLAERLRHASGIQVTPAGSPPWSMKLWKQTSRTGWSRAAKRNWAETLVDSESWMQVRHCLTHGLEKS